MAKPEYDLVVIGGGAGGLVVAAGGAALGAKVAVVEKHRSAATACGTAACRRRRCSSRRTSPTRCVTPTAGRSPLAAPQPDLARVMERVAGVIKGIEPNDSPERFRGLGVDVISATAGSSVRTPSRSTAAG